MKKPIATDTAVDQFRTSTFLSDSRVRRKGTARSLTLPLKVTTMSHLLSRSWKTQHTLVGGVAQWLGRRSLAGGLSQIRA